MKKIVPKKNVSEHMADIKNPDDGTDAKKPLLASDKLYDEKAQAEFLGNTPRTSQSRNGGADLPGLRKKPKFKKFLLRTGVFLFLAAVFLWGAGAYAKFDNLVSYFNYAGAGLNNFLNKEDYLNGQVSPDAKNAEKKFSVFDIAKNGAPWENIGALYSGLETLSVSGLGLVNELDALNNNLWDFLMHNNGRELIGRLEKIKGHLESINESNSKLSSLNLGLDNFLEGKYSSPLSLDLEFRHAVIFLGALINWFSSEDDRHVLVFFENPSELRPGGGFIGSYADVVFSGGSIKSIDIRAINDADKELERKIVPPKPLQAIEKGWTIADSNWFPDYSLSAVKAIQFMEESKLYNGKNFFDGALAVSPKVLSGILEFTGPIGLPDRDLVLDKDNFLTEIQNEVQNAQAKGAPSKKIIAELVPEIISRIDAMNKSDRNRIMEKLGGWISKKDALIYFKDKDIQNFIELYGAAGKIFEIPAGFNGNYLNVVSANVGGGKSDLFIKQKVFFKTQLNLDGTAGNHLEISREHTATPKDPWWYRLQSESYIQVFAPPGATLSSFGGGWDRKVVPKTNYSKNGYEKDPLVESIESTLKKNFSYPFVDEFEESGKKVFGFWSKTAAGQKSKITLDYSVRLPSSPSAGQKYEFVFEKQTGSSGNYKFEIYAPVGFVWNETSSPLFEYETADPDGRMVFALTMEK